MTACIARADGAACDHAREPGSLFCRSHELAPAGRRGGWLSAERRRRRLAPQAMLDATSVAASSSRSNRLWVGACPPPADLPAFDLLILAAQEYQPDLPFHGRIIRCPIPNAPLSVHQISMAIVTAKEVTEAMARGRRTLVTCVTGLNRSALVAGLALGRLTRMSVDQIVDHMRRRRGAMALSNAYFVALLRSVIRR